MRESIAGNPDEFHGHGRDNCGPFLHGKGKDHAEPFQGPFLNSRRNDRRCVFPDVGIINETSFFGAAVASKEPFPARGDNTLPRRDCGMLNLPEYASRFALARLLCCCGHGDGLNVNVEKTS